MQKFSASTLQKTKQTVDEVSIVSLFPLPTTTTTT
jgi:hypothetical protein